MKVEIDQSGKIEQTNLDTIIALSNDKKFSVLLNKKNKRILEKNFKKLGKLKSYSFVVFAALIAILLKLTKIKNKIIIDQEYKSHENTIHEKILHFLRDLGEENDLTIEFGRVGKLSRAHDLAAKVGNKKVKADKTISLEEILELVLELDHQKRPRSVKTEERLTQD